MKLTFVFCRAACKALIFLVLLALNPAGAPQAAFETPFSAAGLEFDERLQNESDALLPLFDKMPSVPVYLKDEPVMKSGTNVEKGVAYTFCQDKNSPSVYVKKIFYRNANRKQLVNILKHELTHAWQCRQEIMSGHDANFRRKFEQVGGFGN